MTAAPEEPATVTATAPPGGSATAVSTPATETTTQIVHEDASQLPEISWLWRRVYIFAATIAFVWMVWSLAFRTHDEATLRMTIRNDQILIGLLALLYIAGASTEAITRLIGAIKTTRKETVTSTPTAP